MTVDKYAFVGWKDCRRAHMQRHEDREVCGMARHGTEACMVEPCVVVRPRI